MGETISAFVKSPEAEPYVQPDLSVSEAPTSSPTMVINYKQTALAEAVSNMQAALTANMVGGQDPSATVSDGMRLAAHRSQGDGIQGAGLSPPQTKAEAQYAAKGPSIILPSTGLAACGLWDGGYAEMSIMQWGANPFGSTDPNASATDMKSPILRFANTGPSSGGRRRRMQESDDDEPIPPTYNPDDPWYIVMQMQPPNEDDLAYMAANNISLDGANRTLPDCKLPSDTGMIDCPCNVSQVYDTNVSYVCPDLSFLCPSSPGATEVRRMLTAEDLMYYGGTGLEDEDDAEEQEQQRKYKSRKRKRRLQADDDGGDDGGLQGPQSTNMSDYGALLASLLAAAAAVLGQNPFAINFADAIYTLMVIAFLLYAMFGGLAFFAKWDMADKNALLYLKGLDTEDEEEGKESDEADFKSIFSSKSSKRIAVNFASRTAMERSYYDAQEEAEFEEESYEPEDHHNIQHAELVKEREEKTQAAEDFFQGILPESTLIDGDTMFKDFFVALWTQHDWWAVLAYPSMQCSRYLRWCGLMNDIMLTLLFDTLFFMVMFPVGVCEILEDEEMCLSIPSGVMASMNQCYWEDDACYVEEPPEDFVFNSMISLFVIILSLPPSLVMWTMIASTVNCRPDFDAIGLDGDYWFGRPVEHMSDVDSAALNKIAQPIEDCIHIEQQDRKYGILSRQYFNDFVSVKQETNHLLAGIKEFFDETEHLRSQGKADAALMKKLKAIHERMNMRADGSPILDIWNIAKYGSARARLERRIERARIQSGNIIDALEGFEEGDWEIKDTVLCQEFILEQFTFVKKLGLKMEFFGFDDCFPGTCDPISWLLSWAYIWFIYWFSLYWVFLWGVLVGADTLLLWGNQFMEAFIQDGLAICPIRIFIFFGLTMSLCKPQLREIYHVLRNVATVKMQDGFHLSSELRLVQHFSAACRAARANMTTPQPGARLLMSLDDSDVMDCRRLRDTGIGYVAACCLCTPIVMSFMGEFGGEFGLGMFMPIIWTAFAICNNILFGFTSAGFYIFWFSVCVWIANKLGYLEGLKAELQIYDEYRFVCRQIRRVRKAYVYTKSLMSLKLLFKTLKTYVHSMIRTPRLHSGKARIWMNINRHIVLRDAAVMTAQQHDELMEKEVRAMQSKKEQQQVTFPEGINNMAVKSFLAGWKSTGRVSSAARAVTNRVLWGVGKAKPRHDINKEQSQQMHGFNAHIPQLDDLLDFEPHDGYSDIISQASDLSAFEADQPKHIIDERRRILAMQEEYKKNQRDYLNNAKVARHIQKKHEETIFTRAHDQIKRLLTTKQSNNEHTHEFYHPAEHPLEVEADRLGPGWEEVDLGDHHNNATTNTTANTTVNDNSNDGLAVIEEEEEEEMNTDTGPLSP